MAAAHDAAPGIPPIIIPGHPAECREHLTRLRNLLGPGAYLAGAMPPPVPWWLFRRFP